MDYLLLLLLVEAGGDSAASIYAQQSDQLVPYSLSLSYLVDSLQSQHHLFFYSILAAANFSICMLYLQAAAAAALATTFDMDNN